MPPPGRGWVLVVAPLLDVAVVGDEPEGDADGDVDAVAVAGTEEVLPALTLTDLLVEAQAVAPASSSAPAAPAASAEPSLRRCLNDRVLPVVIAVPSRWVLPPPAPWCSRLFSDAPARPRVPRLTAIA
jgi:hypothetical protein